MQGDKQIKSVIRENLDAVRDKRRENIQATSELSSLLLCLQVPACNCNLVTCFGLAKSTHGLLTELETEVVVVHCDGTRRVKNFKLDTKHRQFLKFKSFFAYLTLKHQTQPYKEVTD